MAAPIDWKRWGQNKAAIEAAMRDGFAAPRLSGGRGSAVLEAARRLGVNRKTLWAWVNAQERRATRGLDNALPDWSLYRSITPVKTVASSSVVRRWVLTAAQDDTRLHGPFWGNLKAFAAYVGATIHVAPFYYQKKLFTDHETRVGVFAEEIRDYLQFDRMECGKVIFCAEMNTLPTAVRPLSGLHSYSRGHTAVFPHAKVALESVPSIPGTPAPIIMTTGCCTIENYIPKKAGLKATFHHVFGATLVEEDSAGRCFCRQLIASSDGSFQDLDLLVRDGNVSAGQRIECVTWGDIHRRKLNRDVALASWGFDTNTGSVTSSGSILDTLRPRFQVFHDLLDGETCNPHESDNCHKKFDLFVRNKMSLSDEVEQAARFLRATEREFCQSVVAESNHDNFIERWLRRADYRAEPVNAMFFLKMQLASYQARERGDAEFSIFRHAMRESDSTRLATIKFCPENGSFQICFEHGGIEVGSHGHRGPNGARGSAAALSKISVKMNIGHTHSASIVDGVYTAGVSGDLDQGYNIGPSSWSHSHVLVYPSSKRTIITLNEGKWRA